MADPAGKVVDNSILTAEARAALEGLREIAARLVRVLSDPDAGDETRRRVVQLLVDIGPAAVEPLVELIKTDPRGSREHAAAVLCELGEAAVPALVECLDHEEVDVRATAAYLFTAVGDADGLAEGGLMRLLDDREELVRQSAAYALGALECRRAVPRLIALATRPRLVVERDADPYEWADSIPYDACAAVEVLGRLGDPRAVRPLLYLVEAQGEGGPVYEEAVRALGQLGDARAAAVVREAFANERVEGAFADAVAAIDGRAALDDLVDLARSEETETRRLVCQVLVGLGSPAAAEAVAGLLVDSDADVRAATRQALAWTVDEATVDEIVAGLEDSSPDKRAWATALLPVACAWSD